MRNSFAFLTAMSLLALSLAAAWGQPAPPQGKEDPGRVAAIIPVIKTTNPARLGAEMRYDQRVLEYVEQMLRDYDKNGDGFVDNVEWKEGRWSTPPEESDTDQDGRLSKAELQLRIARRFGLQPVAVAADPKPEARPGRKLIAFEIVIIERAGNELAGEKKAPTAAQLLQLEKDGKGVNVQRLKLTALENVEARLMLGEDAPFISGRTRGGSGGPGGFGGATQESVTYNSIGTTVTLTAETEASGSLLASINLVRSSIAPPKAEKAEGMKLAYQAPIRGEFRIRLSRRCGSAPANPLCSAANKRTPAAVRTNCGC